MVMPEMNGLEMMLELTRSFPNVKVIAMSGGLESKGARRGQAVGCASDVSKALRCGAITRCRSIRFGALAGRMTPPQIAEAQTLGRE